MNETGAVPAAAGAALYEKEELLHKQCRKE